MTDNSNGRDPALARGLAELPAIEHGPDFWSKLESSMAESIKQDHRSTSQLAPAHNAAPAEIVELRKFNAEKGRLSSGRRGAVLAVAGLAAAAILVVALLGVDRLRSRETVRTDPVGSEQGPSESNRDDPSATTPPDAARLPSNNDQPGAATAATSYQNPTTPLFITSDADVIGFTPDGSGLLTIGTHPGGGKGSEGAPLLTIEVVPIDGGEPTIALPLDVTIETGTYGGAFVSNQAGHIAWFESCDGYFCGLRTAKVAPDGSISGVVNVAVPQVPNADTWVGEMALAADGSLYLVHNNRLGVVDPGTSVIRPLDDRHASGVAVLHNEALPTVIAVLDEEAVNLSEPDSAVAGLGDYDVRQTAATEDLLFAVSFGDDAIFTIVDLSTGEATIIDDLEYGEDFKPRSVTVSPNGQVAAIGGTFGTIRRTTLIDLGGSVVLELGAGLETVSDARFSADGSAIAFYGSGPDRPSGLYIQRFDGADADLAAAGEGPTELVASFTTEFPCCQARTTNIARASELTDGTIIRSGESFSLNTHLGQRTIETGFVAEGAIVNGELESQIGGGISQYATTLFNSAFFAGLEFETYQSHSLYISRYPRGREATLGWPAPDLVIRNQTPYDVVIQNTYTETSITVELFSTRHIDVEAGDVVRSADGQCAVFTTPRTRTYPDGSVAEDSVFARYRPGEGLDCDGE